MCILNSVAEQGKTGWDYWEGQQRNGLGWGVEIDNKGIERVRLKKEMNENVGLMGRMGEWKIVKRDMKKLNRN